MTEVETILSKKYKEMLGYYNIINISNNTILTGDTTIISSFNSSDISIFNNSLSINTNLLVSGISHLNTISSNSILYSNNCIIHNNLVSTSNIYTGGDLYTNGNLNANTININNSTIMSNLCVTGISIINNNLNTKNIVAFNTYLSFISNKINIGTTNSLININGTALFIINNDIFCNDKLIVVNNKPIDNGCNSGFEIYGINGNGYIKTSLLADRFIIKAPLDNKYNYLTTLDSNNNLIVSGYSLFKQSLTINSTLNILGDTIYNNNVKINLNLFVSNVTVITNTVTMLGNINIDNNVNIYNTALSFGNLTVNGSSILNKTNFNSNVSILDNVQLLNDVTINSSLNSFGCSIFLNNMYINSNIHVSNNSTLYGQVFTNSNLNILNNVVINNSVTINSRLEVIGNSTHYNSVSFCSNVYIGGNTNLKNNIITGNTDMSTFNILGKIICPLKEYQTNSIAYLNNIPLWGFYRTGGIVKLRLDIIPPVIDLLGITTVNLLKGIVLRNPEISVIDNLENDINIYLTSISNNSIDNIIITPIDIIKDPYITQASNLLVGTYTMKYMASDSIGNTITKTRILNVL